MRFEFATATRVVFGPGTATELPSLVAGLGQRVLLVRGRAAGVAQRLEAELGASGLAVSALGVTGEPTTALALEAVALGRAGRCDVVVGVGGGSAIDLAKAAAALLTNGGEPLDYLEVVGRGKPLTERSAPLVAVPTTAGTGAEVTRNAVLFAEAHRVKASLRSPLMLPAVALVDPELTQSLPAAITATTGLDALTQLIEPFVSTRSSPIVDALCREGMARAARSLGRAFHNGSDPAAREDMALASLFGGLALANAALGAVHGFAAPLGGMLGAAHGAICAALLPHVMAANVAALREQPSAPAALARYDDVAMILTGKPEARAHDAVRWVRELCAELGVAGLKALGLGPSEMDRAASLAARASSMKGNPVALGQAALREILERAL